MAGSYREKWWTYKDVNCTERELREALGSHFSTEAMMIGTDKQQTVSGKVCLSRFNLTSIILCSFRAIDRFCCVEMRMFEDQMCLRFTSSTLVSEILIYNIKLHDSDWLREVQFKCGQC